MYYLYNFGWFIFFESQFLYLQKGSIYIIES